MRHRELVLKTLTINSTVRWLIKHKYLNETANCKRCDGRPMRITLKDTKERFFCTRCTTSRSVFKDTLFYDSKKNIIELIDLMYFWSLDLIQTKVAMQANTLSHNTLYRWYDKLCRLAGNIIKKDNPSQMIGGLGHFVQIDESKFSKRKFQVGRVVKSPWIVGGIDYATRDVFRIETIYRDGTTLKI
jgi:transposase-like protein